MGLSIDCTSTLAALRVVAEAEVAVDANTVLLCCCRYKDEIMRCLTSLATLFSQLNPDTYAKVIIISPLLETKFLRTLFGPLTAPFE